MTKDAELKHECRFVVHLPPPRSGMPELHFVKRQTHSPDGTVTPTVTFWEDFKRPFYLTKPAFRKHKQKKEWEYKSKLKEYKTRDCDLPFAVLRALEKPIPKNPRIKQILQDPYVYGADIPAKSIIKRMYKEKFPDVNTPYTICTSDTESDVVHGHGQISMMSMMFGTKLYTAVHADFLKGIANPIDACKAAMQKYLGHELTAMEIEWELELVPREIDVVINCLNKGHEWKPDIVSFWNISHDIEKITEACERAGVDPADVFSDPAVPKQYRSFYFKKGKDSKSKANGDTMSVKPADQWHTVYTPASFYLIDQMCVFRTIRAADGERTSYSLDNILNEMLGERKLTFKQAEKYEGIKLEWHKHMQEFYPVEYVIYHTFDCIGTLKLERKTVDMSVAVPQQLGVSDFDIFKSQPRRLVEDLDGYVSKYFDRIMGTTGSDMLIPEDELPMSRKGWITTLNAQNLADVGLACIKELPGHRTRIYAQLADLDVKASWNLRLSAEM